MGNNLRQLRNARGWTHDRAAEAMGVSRGQFIKLERGERQLTERTVELASRAFGVAKAEVMGEARETVPLVGFVGAGAEANFFADGQGPFDQVDGPPDKTEKTVAVEVRGDSMPNAAEDGWLLYYDDIRHPIDESMVGRKSPLIVGLDNGKVLVKRVRPGTLPGHYHLYSTDPAADPIVNVRIAWAARITWIKPRWNV